MKEIEEPKYRYVRTLVFQANFEEVVALSTLVTQSHEIEMPGIPEGRFYLLGFYWNPLVYDYLLAVKKIFNYNDPYFGGEASIRPLTGKILGDNLAMTITGSWNRNYLFIKPGVHYNFHDAPIYCPDATFWFETHVTIDDSYMLLGQIETWDRFIVTIGTNEPLQQLAKGQSIPPEEVDPGLAK